MATTIDDVNNNTFLLFAPEYAQITRRFSKEQKADFFDAVLDYVSFNFEPDFENDMLIAFEIIKKRITDNRNKYNEKRQKNKENGGKGGRPKTERKPNGFKNKPNANHNDTVTDTDNKDIDKSISVTLAGRLADTVKSKKKISVDGRKISSWAKSIALLMHSDGIEKERIDKALDWYAAHIGEQYVPDIQSGISLREKFLKLEAAIARSQEDYSGKASADKEDPASDNQMFKTPEEFQAWVASERLKEQQNNSLEVKHERAN